jgi:uncharacterized phage protein (TIGR01671 family)
MRTIKFRGKASRKDKDIWLYGDLIKIGDSYHIIGKDDMREDGHHITQDSDIPTWVNEETIGQFTGLFDKNGSEIYEGDILRKPAKTQWVIKNFVGYEIFWHDNDCADGHVGWQMNRHHYQGFLCGTTDFVRCLPKYCNQMEIIGNIHDNPELMKGE